MTKDDVEHVLAEPALAGVMHTALRREVARTERLNPAREYRKYDIYLQSLSDQLEMLRELNEQMPDELRVPDDWLDQEAVSSHTQSVTDLEFFFVVLDSLENTRKFNFKLIQLTHPYFLNVSDGLDVAPMRLHQS